MILKLFSLLRYSYERLFDPACSIGTLPKDWCIADGWLLGGGLGISEEGPMSYDGHMLDGHRLRNSRVLLLSGITMSCGVVRQ